MAPDAPNYGEQIRAAEVIAALSLATDLGIGVPLEHGLQSTLIAMRLGEQLGVDAGTASQTYYTCLLFYVGCTANADIAAEIFGQLAGTVAKSESGYPSEVDSLVRSRTLIVVAVWPF